MIKIILLYHQKINYTGWGKNSNPLQFFAVFSETVLNFNLKFDRFIY